MMMKGVKGGLKLNPYNLRGSKLLRGGVGGNARSLRLKHLRLRRKTHWTPFGLEHVGVHAFLNRFVVGVKLSIYLAAIRNITVTTVTPL